MLLLSTEDGIVRSINIPLNSHTIPATKITAAAQEIIDPRKFLTEEILMASSRAKMAELVAKEIYNIRESKNALLRGEADNMPMCFICTRIWWVRPVSSTHSTSVTYPRRSSTR